jgi:hypothetical protein
VFRVIDANGDGVIQQSEIDAAGPDVDLNLTSPLLPADVCSGGVCKWTDQSARKNVRYLYVVRSRDSQGATFSNSPAVNALADLKPKSLLTQCAPTASLTPQSQTINIGQTASSTWASTNSDSCAVNQGVGSVCATATACDAGGSVQVSPQNDTAYTLTCTGAGGPDATSTAQINLKNQAPRAVAGVSIATTSPRTYATSVRVKQGVPTTLYFAPYTGKYPQTTAISSDPDTDPAKGILNGGSCEWNTDLSVDSAVPDRFDTQIDKTTTIGDGFPFDSVNAAKDCVASATHNFADAGGVYHLYRLVDKLGAKSNVADVTITAVAAPQITSFTATPSLIGQGDSFVLAWTSAGTASCSSSDFAVPTTGDTTRGSVNVGNLSVSPKTYRLNCVSTDTDLYPTPATQTVTVSIKPADGDIKVRKAGQPASANTDGPLMIQRGEKIILSKTSSNARTCAITDDQPDFDNITDTTITGEISPAQSPPRSMIFTLTCNGDGGADATPDTVVVNVDNVLPVAVAGASLDTSSTRTYAKKITVTQGVPAKIYMSAGGSTDTDGGIRSCQWNSTFNQDPPIADKFDRKVSVTPAVSPVGDECSTVISSLAFPLSTEDQSVLGLHTYRVLTVTDDKGGVSVPATLQVNILPRLAVSLSATPASGDAPFAPSLRADIMNYTGPASDTGNFYFWFDCANTSNDLGTVKAACGDPASIPDTGGDRACTVSGDKKMAKCETVPLQGFEFLSLTAPGYDARVQAYTPKVLVERGSAQPAESRTSATANVPFAYTLTKTGGDLDVVKGAPSQTTTIDFKRTGGTAQQVSFAVAGLPTGTTASFNPSSCTSDCTTTLSVSAAMTAAAGGPVALTVSGSAPGGTTTSVALMVRDVLTCGPASQSAVVGVPISQLTAAGGTGTYLWEALNPTAPPTLDPNASPNTGTGANFKATFNTSAARIVRVSSGIQTATCSVNLTGQTLGAAISAVPDHGTEPVQSVITGQITSASTAVGTINYTFWWDCTNTSATVTDAINGTHGGSACGDPRGTTDLATNYPQIICKSNAAGAKCDGVNPAAIPGFDPVNNPLQIAYVYGAAGSPYTPKVIIERGAAPAAEARYTGQVIASYPALTAACAVPATATAGQNVSWTATASGGSGQYVYSWAGSDDLQGKSGTPASVTYFAAGTKTGVVTVRDTATSTAVSPQCSTVISLPQGGAPVAIAGISRDSATSRVYRSSIDVKKGESVTLYFAAERTNASNVIEKSSDPDGWTDQFNGVSTCQINRDLSTEPVTANQFTGSSDFSLANPASPDVCRTSQPQAFSNDAENDAQISRTIAYNILRLVDRQSKEGVGQASVVVHYQPEIASFTVNGGPGTSVNSGDPVEIKWNARHATSCTGTGFDTGGSPSGSRTVNPTSDTTYSISCSGSPLWGPATASAAVTMSFNFKLSTSKSTVATVQGSAISNVITVTRTRGTAQAVAFSAAGLPAGATAVFNPASCNPGISSCTSTLTLSTTRGMDATPAGVYPVKVTGTAGPATASAAPFDLRVSSQMTVSLAALPSAVGPAPYVLQLRADAPAVDYTGDPGDKVTYTFWKNCDQPGTDVSVLVAASVCGSPDYIAGNTSDLSSRTTDLIYTQAGSYRGKVVAVRNAAAAESRVTITVDPPFNYGLTLDRSRIEMVQDTTVSSANRAVITHVSGNSSSVPFSARITNLPPSVVSPVITFNPVACTPPAAGTCGSDISLTVPRETPAGDYSVAVSAGSQTAVFTLAVTSRISVALSALPSDRGAAPLGVRLKADTSNYTGSSNDALNYTFWWDCNNTTDSPSDAVAACGNPNDSAIGFKMNSTLQLSVSTPTTHAYPAEGVYFAKIIIERGGARREARIPITVGNPKVAVTCSVSPVSAVINQPVVWTATPSNGAPPYGFNWTKDVSCGLNPDKCVSVSMRYASAGDKFGSVTVTDGAGDTASRLCDNSLKVYQPTLVITPAAVQIRADGESVQLAAKYDPDGPDGSLPEADVANSASWSIPLSDQNKATISATGLVISRSATGNATVNASYRDAFNNVIPATAVIGVIARDALICDPAQQTVRVGEPTFPMSAAGGTGSYDWIAQEIDAVPRTGSTAGSQTFTTTFGSVGAKTVKVTSGSQSGSCKVSVTDQNLAVNLSAFPASVTVPQSTRLTAVVSGNALGTMNYSWWWNCGADKDPDNTTRVEIAEGRCGEVPHGVSLGQCQENQFGAVCAGITAASKALDHAYADAGSMTPKVIVERGNAAPAQSKTTITVDAANRPPVAVAGISANSNANRVYSTSIVVTQNVPTQIYFAAFTGTARAPDETSADPDGWTNKLNGMYHPQDQTATGQCAWNADLDRNAQVSFEDVSGSNRNPASSADCVTSFVHNFSDLGPHTYAVLRMTDNRGGVSAPALVTVDVVAPGAPIAVAGISVDSSANRVYRDTVQVKQGEDAQLWVSAQRGSGPTAVVSSDPDGWSSKNGGVAKGGSCRWNRDLDRGVFPAGIPTYEWVINDPLDPTEDCDTRLVNEQNTSFTRVFTDPPGTYSYEALRIFDNTGLRSNKAMISVQVLPSAAPVAVASASTDGGKTFSNIISVVRGEPAAISFSATGSTDPDGWTNPVNGVSASGQCAWNNTLSQEPVVAFSDIIRAPSSPSACNLPAQTYTFNDRPGVIDYQVLKIADNKNIQSNSATISVVVMAPDLVISSGPTPTSVASLVEGGSVSFTGKVKNQGDAGTTATFNITFMVDIGNDGSTDLTIGPTPTVAGLTVGAEKTITSGVWNSLPPGTHKVTMCADQLGSSVTNEFFTGNNCSSQVITILPDDRAPVAEAGISLDGTTYGASITVLRGQSVQIWLSADKDVTGDGQASFDPDGWADPARGVAFGGKCEWNLDLASQFGVQNTVSNPASPAICNRNRMDKTFNDPAGVYVYPVLRVTDTKLKQSNVAAVSVRVVDSLVDLNHIDCVASMCTVVSGAGANVCSAPGGACTGGAPGGPPGGNLPDLAVSDAPRLASGELRKDQKVTFSAVVKNQGAGAVTHAFDNVFLVDINNNGTVDLSLRTAPRTAQAARRAQFAALPIADITLPQPATVPELQSGASAPVVSSEWRGIPAGTHRIIVCADSDGTVNESDETNNCASTVMTVESGAPAAGPLRVDSCRSSVSSARAGELVDWTGQVSGGTGAYSFSWSGDIPLEGVAANPASVAYRTTGTKSGSLIVTSGDETASRACGTVNITPGILSFTASPNHINPGQSSLLSWDTTGFSSCMITADQPGQSIGPVDTSGSRTVQPSRDTRYTLSCVGASQSQSVTIIVSSVPKVEEVVPK